MINLNDYVNKDPEDRFSSIFWKIDSILINTLNDYTNVDTIYIDLAGSDRGGLLLKYIRYQVHHYTSMVYDMKYRDRKKFNDTFIYEPFYKYAGMDNDEDAYYQDIYIWLIKDKINWNLSIGLSNEELNEHLDILENLRLIDFKIIKDNKRIYQKCYTIIPHYFSEMISMYIRKYILTQFNTNLN